MGGDLRKNYNSLDLAKFACAIMIISAHFAAERASFPILLDYAFSVYIIAVPFFYTCSGFLFFDKLTRTPREEHRGALFKSLKRIMLMYVAWSLIYFAFVLVNWATDGTTTAEVLRYFHTSLVFTTYPTIWFLPALAAALAITYLLSRRLPMKTIFLMSLVCYVIGSLGYSYSFVQEELPWLGGVYDVYSKIFMTTRNGVFNGFPFVALGALLAGRKERMRVAVSGSLAVGAMAIVVVEAFALKELFGNVGADTAFFILLLMFFLFEFLLGLDLKDRKVYRTFRDISLLMFVSQRLFLTALPSVLPATVVGTLCANPYIGLAAILLTIIGFSVMVIKLGEKLELLQILY